jgi:hypothetical protein
MTLKEKADELVLKYYELVKNKYPSTNGMPLAIQSALIAVDEIINSSPSLPILGDSGSYGEDIELSKIYWEEVKQEIKNI